MQKLLLSHPQYGTNRQYQYHTRDDLIKCIKFTLKDYLPGIKLKSIKVSDDHVFISRCMGKYVVMIPEITNQNASLSILKQSMCSQKIVHTFDVTYYSKPIFYKQNRKSSVTWTRIA